MSLLKEIHIENFMSIKEATATFDESNILSLCGYNNSGKSAMTRSQEVLFYNAYANEQVNYIYDGDVDTEAADYFLIRDTFDDGVVIERYKFRSGKSEYIMSKNGVELYSNKLENATISVSGIPKLIADYLGVIEDDATGEYLNVRRNTDKLFLVATSGGDNYKMLNSILRNDVLVESTKRMNADKNKVQNDLMNAQNTRSTLFNELSTITVVDEKTLKNMKERNENLALKRTRVEYLMALVDSKEKVNAIMPYDELNLTDTAKLTLLNGIAEAVKAKNKQVSPECNTIEVTRLNDLKVLIKSKETLDSIKNVSYAEVTPLDVIKYKDIMDVCKVYNDLYVGRKALKLTEDALEITNAKLQETAKANNYKLCGNCGSLVV